MGGWFEIAGVIIAAFLGAVGGRSFSRLKNPHWGWGYFLPLMLIFLLLLITYAGLNAFTPLFAWISSGRVRFVIIALSVTMGCYDADWPAQKPHRKSIRLCRYDWRRRLGFGAALCHAPY